MHVNNDISAGCEGLFFSLHSPSPLVNYVIGHEEGEGHVINLIMASFIFKESAQSGSMHVCMYHAVPIFTADLISCRTAAPSSILLSRHRVRAGDGCEDTKLSRGRPGLLAALTFAFAAEAQERLGGKGTSFMKPLQFYSSS